MTARQRALTAKFALLPFAVSASINFLDAWIWIPVLVILGLEWLGTLILIGREFP